MDVLFSCFVSLGLSMLGWVFSKLRKMGKRFMHTPSTPLAFSTLRYMDGMRGCGQRMGVRSQGFNRRLWVSWIDVYTRRGKLRLPASLVEPVTPQSVIRLSQLKITKAGLYQKVGTQVKVTACVNAPGSVYTVGAKHPEACDGGTQGDIAFEVTGPNMMEGGTFLTLTEQTYVDTVHAVRTLASQGGLDTFASMIF